MSSEILEKFNNKTEYLNADSLFALKPNPISFGYLLEYRYNL